MKVGDCFRNGIYVDVVMKDMNSVIVVGKKVETKVEDQNGIVFGISNGVVI